MPFRSSLAPVSVIRPFHDTHVKLGILHSGGPAPGGNQVLYAAALRAKDHGLPIIAFRQGYEHLMSKSSVEILKNWSMEIGKEEIRYLRDQVPLVPGSSRANPGKAIRTIDDLSDPKRTASLTRVIENLNEMNIGALISIGGDDTMRTANLLQLHLDTLKQKGAPIDVFKGLVHVPKTIDKDYVGIDYTFGFMSAADAIGERVKALHDDAKATATSAQLVYHIAEIMGRSAGWLCAAASIYGQATYAIVPEDYVDRGSTTIEELANNCVDVILTRKRQGKNYGVFTIAEGLGDLIPNQEASKDEYGHTRFDELELAARLKHAIKKEYTRRSDLSLKVRSRTIGYDVRQIKPNIFDVLLCQRLGVSAVDAILENKLGNMISVTGVLNPKLVPFSELTNPDDLKVSSWTMGQNEGLYKLMLSMEQPFKEDVDK
ncbi:MAG: 6-phosphofructokinase [Myxococcota bacterium]|nr:6-phosphofructokinase [Myxococcota bacterium]